VWLFAMVLGHSRMLWAQYVLHQDLGTVLRCHMEAFEFFGGVPAEILYDRMKTAVLGEQPEERSIVYNAKLLGLAEHYGFAPRACQPYRAKTKGKVERPYRYVREDFFLARRFANIGDLNAQLQHWLATVANVRVHGTTRRVVAEHFAEEHPALGVLPAGRFDAVLQLARRVSREGYVSIGGNLYSIPDGTPRRLLDVELTAQQVRIHEGGALIAVHALLPGRGQRSLLPGHRHGPHRTRRSSATVSRISAPGQHVAARPLAVYDLVAQRLGQRGAA
jgi:hypothetical protein